VSTSSLIFIARHQSAHRKKYSVQTLAPLLSRAPIEGSTPVHPRVVQTTLPQPSATFVASHKFSGLTGNCAACQLQGHIRRMLPEFVHALLGG